jgi:cysteine-rich repeat protein
MRRKTHSVALALVTGAAVGAPLLSSSSCNTTSATAVADAGPDSTALVAGVCGDGVVNVGEQCDLGPDGGPGCGKDCTFFCIADTINGNALCDDHNPCNGVETCAGENNDAGAAPHTCAKGTPPPEGTACGSGSTCHDQACAGAAVCGDGVVEGTEECDLGSNNGTNQGCGADCRWTCVAGDATRSCAPTSACEGQGTCNGATHVCAPGAAVTDGTSCGTGQVCRSGICVSAECGDGVVEAPEQCDLGAANGVATGCEADCTFSCTLSPNDCVTPDPCEGANTCTAFTMGGSPAQKCVVAAPPDGGACVNGGTCQPDHLCASPDCGNGTLDPGEQCDWGTSMNVHGSGCEPDCTFSCSTSPLSSNACASSDPCSASPQVCRAVPGPGSSGGQKCEPGTVLGACASCGGTSVCVNHTCRPSECGDGCVVAPETCDPPGASCDSTCQQIVCGDGKLGGAEQCDDGNTLNLDGCDSTCNFEQVHRATSLQYSSGVDSFCTLNALGTTVITRLGLSAIQSSTDTDVASGTTSVIFKFSGVAGAPVDLSGTSGAVVLGSLSGTPQHADAGAYDGTADVDWWYTVDPTTIDAQRNPLNTMTGTFVNKTLQAGPALLALKVNLSGSPAALQMWNAKISVSAGGATTPLTSAGGPPGHLASEHVKSSLTTFQTGGVGGSGPTGQLCGNITAFSLSQVVTPSLLVSGGLVPCAEDYTSANSLLDVLVHGCTVNSMAVMNPSQPDQVLATAFTAQDAGATTGPYVLSSSSGANPARAVDTCKDSSSSPKTVPLTTCLQGLAFSSAFTFQTDRVIIKP